MIRIVLVDSHQLFRVSLRSLIDSFPNCEVILDVSSLREIPKDFDPSVIHLVIFDPGETKKTVFESVQDFFKYSRMMILSDMIGRDDVMEYMEMGISGYFSKEDCPSQLERAITEISKSYDFEEVRLGAVVRQSLINDVGYRQRKKINFTDREVQVLKLVCMEKTNAEISDILGLSVRTIESHRRRMIDKVDCRSIIGVILNALELKSVNLKLPINNTNQAS